MTWAEVNQAPIPRAEQRYGVTISLSPMRSTTFMWLTVTNQVAAQLEWQSNSKLSLWMGHDKLAGWMKIAPSIGGRNIKLLGRVASTMTCPLVAPADWQGLACAKTRCTNWRVQGNALLVEIPWDFSATEEAEQEAA